MTSTPSSAEFAHLLVLISQDSEFVQTVSAAFDPSKAFDLQAINTSPAAAIDALGDVEPKLAIIDLGAGARSDCEVLGC